MLYALYWLLRSIVLEKAVEAERERKKAIEKKEKEKRGGGGVEIHKRA